jgi:hypothetical protein
MADPARAERVPLRDRGDGAPETPLDRGDDALFRPVVVGSPSVPADAPPS